MLTLSLGLFAFVVQVFVTSAATSPCISELAYQNIFSSPLQQYTSSDFNVICFGNFDSEGGGDLEGIIITNVLHHNTLTLSRITLIFFKAEPQF